MTLWEGIGPLVDSAPSPEALRFHRIHLFAARHWRAQGRPVPEDFVEAERWAALTAMTAPLVLERVRAAYGEPVVVLKGPEAAARYPDETLRPFNDLDLLVRDPVGAQDALLAAGFEPIGHADLYVDIQHLRPLACPGLPLHVELHSRPKWPDRLEPPSSEQLLGHATPSSTGVEGVLALQPTEHALILAAHAWAHTPLRRLLDIVDVAAAADGLDRGELDRLAREWRLERVWRTTIAAADALLMEGRRTVPIRTWARHLPAVREQTVLEAHLERLLSGYWELPLPRALRATVSAAGRGIRPVGGETWSRKLRRASRAARHAFQPMSTHDEALGRDRLRAPRRKR